MESDFLFTSERLRFRRFSERDATAFFELNNDPLVIRYTGDPPFESEEHARQFLLGYDHYETVGFGRWSVELIASGEFIGWAGLKQSTELNEVDVGCRFFQRFWRQGFGTESISACMRYGFEELGIPRIVGRAMIANTGSVKMLQKAGMRYVGPRDCADKTGVVYEMTASDWQTKNG